MAPGYPGKGPSHNINQALAFRHPETQVIDTLGIIPNADHDLPEGGLGKIPHEPEADAQDGYGKVIKIKRDFSCLWI